MSFLNSRWRSRLYLVSPPVKTLLRSMSPQLDSFSAMFRSIDAVLIQSSSRTHRIDPRPMGSDATISVANEESSIMRILVIEDEQEIADFVVRGLREEGFTVEHAADGDAGWHALQAAATGTSSCWTGGCPGPDGLTLLRRFRQAGHETPVLFLTARDAVSDRVRGLDGGADDYLCKPFVFEELLARVRRAGPPAIGREDHRATHGDVRLDLATQRAERAGRRLDLTAKEQALLVFFLRHPGEVLSRTRIYEHVWDERYDGLSNTLEVHVMELRRKLEAHGPRLIHTLRGRGYLFGEPPGGASSRP